MPKMTRPPKCFISYRRLDANQSARWLAMDLTRAFGPKTVFIDKEGIEGGARWPEKILAELASSSVVLALIGTQWLSSRDKFYRRRIDQKDDWVRRELAYAFKHKIDVIPLLLEGAARPEEEALPPCLKPLSTIQAIDLHPSNMSHSHLDVVKALEEREFKRQRRRDLERPNKEARRGMVRATEKQIGEFIKANPGWTIEVRGTPGNWKTGLVRDFDFDSFAEALGFMIGAGRDIKKHRHYPEWINVWHTVRVWYSTWDLGDIVSNFDIKMAILLENIYKHYDDRLDFELYERRRS